MSIWKSLFGVNVTPVDWRNEYHRSQRMLKKVSDRLHDEREKKKELIEDLHRLNVKYASSVPREAFDEIERKHKDALKNYSDCEQSGAKKIAQERANAAQSERARNNTIEMIAVEMRAHRFVPRKKLAAIIGRNDLAKWKKGTA